MAVRLAAACCVLSPLSAGAAEPLRILPLGDSLTRGNNDINHPDGDIPGGYRRSLDAAMMSTGVPHDFIGSRSDNAAPDMDPHHEGNPGWRTDELLAIAPAAIADEPHAVLLLAGTNDILQRVPVATALGNLESLVDTITLADPDLRLFVATIPPITQSWKHAGVTTSEAVLNADAESYNSGLRDIVAQKAGAGRRVELVDLNALLVYTDAEDPSNDFYQPGDGIHPGQAGYDQMAGLWFAALSAADLFPPQSPYDLWTASYPDFSALPEADRAPLGDANGDGLPNLLAYAFLCDPLAPVPADASPALAPAEGGWTFRFRRNRLATDLAYQVLSASAPGGDWQETDGPAVVTEVPGMPDAEDVALTLPAGGPERFFRLRVERTAE